MCDTPQLSTKECALVGSLTLSELVLAEILSWWLTGLLRRSRDSANNQYGARSIVSDKKDKWPVDAEHLVLAAFEVFAARAHDVIVHGSDGDVFAADFVYLNGDVLEDFADVEVARAVDAGEVGLGGGEDGGDALVLQTLARVEALLVDEAWKKELHHLVLQVVRDGFQNAA